jgi:propionate catabolism operon transcriptional regulator
MPDLFSTAAARPRICFLAYRHIAELAAPVVAEYAHRADIEIVEASFNVALSIARQR